MLSIQQASELCHDLRRTRDGAAISLSVASGTVNVEVAKVAAERRWAAVGGGNAVGGGQDIES